MFFSKLCLNLSKNCRLEGKRWWCNGQHWCLPSIRSGFDSRPSQFFKRFSDFYCLIKAMFGLVPWRKKYSATGNRTPVSRVTGGDTHHYTIVELFDCNHLLAYIAYALYQHMIFRFLKGKTSALAQSDVS